MDLLDEWTAALDLPIGPLMEALIRAAAREPFDALELMLDDSFERIPGMTPEDVRVFARNGFDLAHYAFVVDADVDPEASTDERPICLAEKGDCHVIAPDLAGFLSVAAIAGAYAIERDRPDAEYFALRAERLKAEDVELHVGSILRRPYRAGGDDFREASDHLCRLPGVRMPESPGLIVRACPDREFDLRLPEEPLTLTLPAVQALVAAGNVVRATKTLEALVARWIDLGDLIPPANWTGLKEPLARLRPIMTAEVREALKKRGAWPES